MVRPSVHLPEMLSLSARGRDARSRPNQVYEQLHAALKPSHYVYVI